LVPTSKKSESIIDVSAVFRHEGHRIDEALRRGVQLALERHRERGAQVAVWRSGQVVWLKPEEFDV
jgi:hypothetical protein